MWPRRADGRGRLRGHGGVGLLLLVLLKVSATQKVITAEEEAVQVQALAGGAADLPCDISPHQLNDSVLLVVWYREDTPIYSWDARSGRGEEEADEDEPQRDEREGEAELEHEGAHWSAWGGRARWSPLTAQLALRPATTTDRGDYRCRADFRASPTRNTRVSLQVIEAAGAPVVTDEAGRVLEGRAGPYREGDSPSLLCISEGGFPPATVRWYRGERLLTAGPTGGGRALLAVGPLWRADLLAALSCHATNSPLLTPSTTTIVMDLQLPPLKVEVWLSEGEAMSAGREHEVSCRAHAGRPPPVLTMWLQGQQLHGEQEEIKEEKEESRGGEWRGGSSIMRVLLTANSSQHGHNLTCRVAHPLLAEPLEASLSLNVLFPPSVNLSLGATLNPHDIEEGDDVYFECHVLANPIPYKLIWEHNGRPLAADPKAGVTMSGGNLVLRGVGRTAAGSYACAVSNVEGDARSTPVALQVMFKPVCSTHLRRTYGVGRQERVQLVCEVDAVPAPDSFSWALNNSAQLLPVASERYSWTGTPARSILSFAPVSDQDYGTALCWASNLVGRQAEPCALTILPAARPHPPANCSLANLTSVALDLSCEEGWDGGMPQRFQLEVWDEEHLLANVSAGRPAFSVGGLRAGRALRLVLYSHNSRGRSPPQNLDAYTLELAEKRTDESTSGSGWDAGWLAAVGGGAAAALLLLLLCAATILKLRSRSRRHHSDYNVNMNKPKTATRSELQQQQTQQDDKNPDVVPLSKGGEHKVILEEQLDRGEGGEGLLPRPPPYSRAPPLLTHALPVARAGREVVTTRAPLPAAQESDV